MSEPTALYRLYASSDVLLYVGVTKNLRTRLRGHARKAWWPQVARQEIAWHETRDVALRIEAEIIKSEKPLHNRCFQVGRLPAGAAVEVPGPRSRVTINGVARMFGVNKATARQWRDFAVIVKQVEPFPPAAGKVAATDYWWADEIQAWARRTGRLKETET